MNGSGKQSYYEIQLSNGSLIAAFLVAAAVGVTVFVLGVMVGRGQAPQALPEAGWTEPLAANGGGDSGPAPMQEAEPIVDIDTENAALGTDGTGTDDAGTDDTGTDATAPPFEDRVGEDEAAAASGQPAAPAGLPTNDPALASGWVVQVKSTENVQEARVLQEELSKSGFPSFMVQADVRGQSTWRVRVGRYGTQADAEQVAAALSGRTDIEATWVTQG